MFVFAYEKCLFSHGMTLCFYNHTSAFSGAVVKVLVSVLVIFVISNIGLRKT